VPVNRARAGSRSTPCIPPRPPLALAVSPLECRLDQHNHASTRTPAAAAVILRIVECCCSVGVDDASTGQSACTNNHYAPPAAPLLEGIVMSLSECPPRRRLQHDTAAALSAKATPPAPPSARFELHCVASDSAGPAVAAATAAGVLIVACWVSLCRVSVGAAAARVTGAPLAMLPFG